MAPVLLAKAFSARLLLHLPSGTRVTRPWPFRVTWHHWSRHVTIRLALCGFL